MAVNIKSKSSFKKTILNEMPQDWEIKQLKDVGTIQSGGTPDTSVPNYWDGNINWCTPTDIGNLKGNKYIGETVVKITENGLKKSSAFLLPEGSLIVCTRATIGKAVINKVPIATNQGFKNVIPHSIYVDFLYYRIIFDENKLTRIASGSTFLEISKKDFSSFSIPVPTSPEQKAIAKCLSIWDNGIEKITVLIAKKELQKKALMQQLLTGNKRLKTFNGEWKEYHLCDMFNERNERGTQNMRLLSIGQNGVYPQTESNKKDTSNEDKSKYKKICVGDIGYNTMRMWQGRSALSNLEGIVSPAYTIITPKDTADSKFFSYLFKTSKAKNLFWRNSQGLVDDTLNCKFKDFAIIKFILPEKEEQIAIAEVLEQADKEIMLLKVKMDKLKEQKKGLMQVLLTGNKRLKFN